MDESYLTNLISAVQYLALTLYNCNVELQKLLNTSDLELVIALSQISVEKLENQIPKP